jgi:hypothetical protein
MEPLGYVSLGCGNSRLCFSMGSTLFLMKIEAILNVLDTENFTHYAIYDKIRLIFYFGWTEGDFQNISLGLTVKGFGGDFEGDFADMCLESFFCSS